MKSLCVKRAICWILPIFSIILASCSGDQFDGPSIGSSVPGSVLRETAGMPASFGEEFVILSEYNNLREDSIASCMRSNGFKYFPEKQMGNERVKSLGLDLSSADFANQFGFGISNGLLQGLNSDSDEDFEYLSSLSERELESYWLTLHGEHNPEHPGTENHEIGGCLKQALDSVDLPPWHANLEWLNDVSTELSQRLSADTRIIQIERQWIQCMAKSGYDGLTSEEELNSSLNNEFIQLFQTLVPTRPFDNGEEFIKVLDKKSKAALDEFRSKEIELAVASHECSHETDETVMAISKEIEREIISVVPLN